MAVRQLLTIAAGCAVLAACGTDPVNSGPGPGVDTSDVTSEADTGAADVAPDVPDQSCLTDYDCAHPGVASGCDEPICDKGVCANKPAEKGTFCEVKGWIGGVCEQRSCDGKGQCVAGNVADGTGCGDVACGEICQQGECKAGASADDGNPCTVDTCKGGVINHEAIDDPTAKCDDGDPCTHGDACAFGKCAGNTANCNDGVDCTIDFCDAKAGCVSMASLPMCNDGDPCTKHVCDAKTGCKAAGGNEGTPCDDGNPCTVGDGCDADGQCVGSTNTCDCQVDSDCKANNPCLKLTCQAGKCMSNPDQVVDCDDSDSGPCATNSCDAKTGECALKPINEGKACGDDDPCTVNSACAKGKCAGKKMLDCDDGNGCTVDICSEGVGCVHKGSEGPCDDGNACSAGDTCQAGVCAGEWKSCSDGDACTIDKCDAKTGKCQYVKKPDCGGGCKGDDECADDDACTQDLCAQDGKCVHKKMPNCPKPGCKSAADCDDKNACTKDLCGPDAQCQHKKLPNCPPTGCKDASGCDDNNACTFEICINGKCQYQKLSCNDGDNCTKDACNPATGGCFFEKIPGCGAGCQTHQDCASADKCMPKYCVSKQCKAYPKNCNDYDDCTTDSCNSQSGQCVFKKIAGCVSNKCKTKADCDDKKVCTNDYCQLQTGKCFNTNIPNCDPTKPKCKANSDCNDNKPCTYDYCNTYYGTCSNNAIPNCDPTKPKCKSKADCDDGEPCTNDTCHAAYGTCYNTKIYGCTAGNPCKTNAQCADNNKCTSNLCLKNKCAAKPISCDDYNPCTKDTCQSYTGKCFHQPVPGCVATKCAKQSDCDDQNKCTKDVCEYGWCKHVMQPGCAPSPGG